MHAATVALSELHEAVFADRLTRVLGVSWETRDRGRDRNLAWAITQVPEKLAAAFSSRSDTSMRRKIDSSLNMLNVSATAINGNDHQATSQATLSTRPEKIVHSLADLTSGWRARAGNLLGEDATVWAGQCCLEQRAALVSRR